MKKIWLFAVLFTFLALSLSNLPAVSKTPNETRVTGILHFSSKSSIHFHPPNSIISVEAGYWLESDKPIYVHQGSKSEASTNVVKLHVPVNLQEKAKKLDGKHVVVVGSMDCTSSGWGPGHASCDMVVEKIAKFGEAVTHGSEMEDLLGISVNLDRKEITISVASTGCTDKTYFLFEVKDNVLTIIRTKRDSCKAMPKEVHLTYSFEEIGINPNESFKIANSFLTSGDIWQKTR